MKMFFVFDFAIVKDNAPGLLTGAFFSDNFHDNFDNCFDN